MPTDRDFIFLCRYIKCDGLAQRALKDAESGELVFHPDSAIKDWNRWLGTNFEVDDLANAHEYSIVFTH